MMLCGLTRHRMGESRYDRPEVREAMRNTGLPRRFVRRFPHLKPNLQQAAYHSPVIERFPGTRSRLTPAPTSLLYKKTKIGYDLIGRGTTMPKRVTEEQFERRVPQRAQWHLHVPPKLDRPSKETERACRVNQVRPASAIDSPEACDEAGGTMLSGDFRPVVHVTPFEDYREKISGTVRTGTLSEPLRGDCCRFDFAIATWDSKSACPNSGCATTTNPLA